MTFKDVRDLSEHLKLLGFPNVFPLQALSSNYGSLASFHVVAQVLCWLAGLLEPGAILNGGLETEDDRILLIRSAVEFFVTKSAIKLNPRKLYAASAITATELQKITRLLIAPTKAMQDERDDDDNQRSLHVVDIGDKMDDLRRARELSSDLTQRGATLHDLLTKELHNKETRLAQANRPLELSSVERALKNAIGAAQIKLQSSRTQLENSKIEMNALNSKLQRKSAELERIKQRLDALQKIRPAHMKEFEESEEELKVLFAMYFKRLHLRDALRAQIDARTKIATPIHSPVLQKQNETSSIPFIPEGLIDDDDDDVDYVDENDAVLDMNDISGIGGIGGIGISAITGKKQQKQQQQQSQQQQQQQQQQQRRNFGLDAEIPDIRDEDLMLRNSENYNRDVSSKNRRNKRPGTATSRGARPTTGRSRRLTNVNGKLMQKTRTGDAGATDTMTFDDSSFGSSDSEFDIGDVGMSGAINANEMSRNLESELDATDEFDLNSMDDISISKITGELPLRPKTGNKVDHHSDEDF